MWVRGHGFRVRLGGWVYGQILDSEVHFSIMRVLVVILSNGFWDLVGSFLSLVWER